MVPFLVKVMDAEMRPSFVVVELDSFPSLVAAVVEPNFAGSQSPLNFHSMDAPLQQAGQPICKINIISNHYFTDTFLLFSHYSMNLPIMNDADWALTCPSTACLTQPRGNPGCLCAHQNGFAAATASFLIDLFRFNIFLFFFHFIRRNGIFRLKLN